LVLGLVPGINTHFFLWKVLNYFELEDLSITSYLDGFAEALEIKERRELETLPSLLLFAVNFTRAFSATIFHRDHYYFFGLKKGKDSLGFLFVRGLWAFS
jgi:hypothetical protein